MRKYKRPPITEAVIEVRFEQANDKATIESAKIRLLPDYGVSEEISAVGIRLDVLQRQAQFDEGSSGSKLFNKDRTDILMIMPQAFATSRVAPYCGWDEFSARAQKNWQTWKRIAGYRKIQRLGVRYINRIDIPAMAGERILIEDYLKVYPEAPAEGVMQGMDQYTMQMSGPIGNPDDNCRLTINSSNVLSPLVNHVSFLFDLDISREGDVPQKDEELWAFVNHIRDIKNDAFEASVTDKARELFDS